MQRFFDAGPTDRFAIYLNDHRSVFAAERDLADRSRGSNESTTAGGELAELLSGIIEQIDSDRARLDHLLAGIGAAPNPLKTIGARIATRLGKLKLNGQLRGYSPLSRVVEIEALIATTAVRRAMWSSLAATTDETVATDAAGREASVSEHHLALVEHHRAAAAEAFGE